MGHYAAEMHLNAHDREPSTQVASTDDQWIVSDIFTVLTVAEFDKTHSSFKSRHGPIPMNPLLYRHGRTIYKTRRGAEKAAMKACEAAVEAARANLLKLKNILKVQRPWEQK